jgi:hypothetical protein
MSPDDAQSNPVSFCTQPETMIGLVINQSLGLELFQHIGYGSRFGLQ